MANESIASIPPSVEDPMVLRRFLTNLVENLDVVLGNRAGADTQYVEQQQLVNAAAVLQDEVAEATSSLDEATNRLNRLLSDSNEDNESRFEAIEALDASQSATLSLLTNVSWYRSVAVRFNGTNINGPTVIELSYNTASVTRSGVGNYIVTLSNPELAGNKMLDRTMFSTQLKLASAAATDLFTAEVTIIDATAGTLSVNIYAMIQGAGTTITKSVYDPGASDTVELVGLLIPFGVTPPA